ncbi:hypothetical protein EST38_g12945 [Candolleomyces aberdarensis]|uniref:Uncharacterized protein n=1 Tax=Candolleomyces aberdarensis TaxID=2316362 RepID=A0A4Q2D1X7_9AGAR|nr:hypothetical protein EST38_g12945 [Candolleomyces aberdarensis]
MSDPEADSVHQSQSPGAASENKNTLTGSDNESVGSYVMGAKTADNEPKHVFSKQECSDEAEAMIFDLEDNGDREGDPDYEEDGIIEEGSKSEEEASDDSDGNHRRRRKLSQPSRQKKTEKALNFREDVSKQRKTKSTSSISQAVQNEIQKCKRLRALEDESDEGDSRKPN